MDEKDLWITNNNIRATNHWDSWKIGDRTWPSEGSFRLFGNSNIGMMHRCNLQVPGMFWPEGLHVVQRWYARTNISPSWDLYNIFVQWSHNVYVTFTMGARPLWCLPLYELFERRPRAANATDEEFRHSSMSDPWPLIILPRENMSVQVDDFDAYNRDYLEQRERNSDRQDQTDKYIWIHVEGVHVSHFEQRGFDKIYKELIGTQRKRESIEQRITTWLAGQIDDADVESRAQLHAVRDGILEGRHRDNHQKPG